MTAYDQIKNDVQRILTSEVDELIADVQRILGEYGLYPKLESVNYSGKRFTLFFDLSFRPNIILLKSMNIELRASTRPGSYIEVRGRADLSDSIQRDSIQRLVVSVCRPTAISHKIMRIAAPRA